MTPVYWRSTGPFSIPKTTDWQHSNSRNARSVALGAGAVRLAWPRGGRLGVAEGVETALSAMQLFGISCWATLGNERFGLVTIPESVRELHLFVDNDAGGRLAEERAREAYACEGRRIVTRPPERSGDDWNDVLLSRQRAAV